MFNEKQQYFLLTGLLLLMAFPATAEEPENRWALSAGLFDFIDKDKAGEAGVEYRFRSFSLWRLELTPVVGAAGTTDGSFWAYGGLRYDYPLSSQWTASPQFAVALYEDGDGKNLGGVVEFRSGLELSYRLKSGHRLGLLFYHLSNARIYELNPGEESLVITWSF